MMRVLIVVTMMTTALHISAVDLGQWCWCSLTWICLPPRSLLYCPHYLHEVRQHHHGKRNFIGNISIISIIIHYHCNHTKSSIFLNWFWVQRQLITRPRILCVTQKRVTHNLPEVLDFDMKKRFHTWWCWVSIEQQCLVLGSSGQAGTTCGAFSQQIRPRIIFS